MKTHELQYRDEPRYWAPFAVYSHVVSIRINEPFRCILIWWDLYGLSDYGLEFHIKSFST